MVANSHKSKILRMEETAVRSIFVTVNKSGEHKMLDYTIMSRLCIRIEKLVEKINIDFKNKAKTKCEKITFSFLLFAGK